MPPREYGDAAFVVRIAQGAGAQEIRRPLEPRMSRRQRELHLVARCEVVRELGLRVGELEAEILLWIQPIDDEGEIAPTHGEQPCAALRRAKWALDDRRCVDQADRHVALDALPRSLRPAETDLGADRVAMELRVRATRHCPLIDDV